MASDKAKITLKRWREKNKKHIQEYNRARYRIVNQRRRERERADPEYREQRRQEWRDWRDRHKEAFMISCRARGAQHRLRQNFGLTLEQFSDLAARQAFRCAICFKEETTLQKRYDGKRRPRTLSVDHDHKTGNRRGLLCRQCNAGLGHFLDDTFLLKRAIRYLEFFKQRHQLSFKNDDIVATQGQLFSKHVT